MPNNVWKFEGITDKENRSIIADQVKVPLFSVKFQSKTSDVTFGIAAPRSPAAVENRRNTGVSFPTPEKSFAFVYLEISWVTRKVPWAPEPLA